MLSFPSFLRGPLQAGYSRSQGASFITSQPAAGPYFAQIETEDVPAFFSVSFIFNRVHAQAFAAWLRLNNNEIKNGAQFEIALSIEDGVVTQVASFTRDGVPQYSGENAKTVTYTAEIMVRKLLYPSEGCESLVLCMPDCMSREALDGAINFI